MTRLRALPIIALTLFVCAISVAAKKLNPVAADYFPLRVGDFWTYHSTTSATEYSLKVLSEEKQADGTIRSLVETSAGVKVQTWYSKPVGWVLMHEERYPEHEALVAKYEPPRQYLQNPLVAGTKWEWTGKDYTFTDIHEKNKVVGFEKVTVPAGKFRAMKVVSLVAAGKAGMTKTYWYAEGVGLVKSTTVGGQITYGWELTDYSFKSKDKK
ncbi:MAG TPA: hypothetical protein VK581_08340 [Chthoniobacterales bacterium]|nr:hypothetical protein [Chthoniobacterales bacterium]